MEATSCLFTSMVEDLNLGKPRTNPASGQSGTQTRDRRIACPTSWPLDRAYMGRQTVGKSNMLVSTRKKFSRSFFFRFTNISLFDSLCRLRMRSIGIDFAE